MASPLPCLVEALVLTESLQRGGVGSLGLPGVPAVGELTLGVLMRGPGRLAEVQRVELARLVRDGVLTVMSATAVEVAAVVRWVGSDALSAGELEEVALVLAGRARLYASDNVVMRLARELGVAEQLVPTQNEKPEMRVGRLAHVTPIRTGSADQK